MNDYSDNDSRHSCCLGSRICCRCCCLRWRIPGLQLCRQADSRCRYLSGWEQQQAGPHAAQARFRCTADCCFGAGAAHHLSPPVPAPSECQRFCTLPTFPACAMAPQFSCSPAAVGFGSPGVTHRTGPCARCCLSGDAVREAVHLKCQRPAHISLPFLPACPVHAAHTNTMYR